jgi:hypothetical protein
MFDSERKAGDTTIIEDESNYRYYVVAFLDRYLDETLTVNTRAIILNSEETDGEAVLDEWKSGEATEDSFAEIADKYNSSELTSAEGGLYESLLTSSISEELAEWLGDESRVSGDTTVISPEDDSYTYVLYYISQGSPEWMVSIKSTLLSNVMADYLEEITADIEVKDPKNRLNYLQVYASQEAAAAAESEAAESAAAEDVSGEDETTVDETTDGDETAADETADGDSTAEGETTDDAADEDASTETDTETTESTSAQ